MDNQEKKEFERHFEEFHQRRPPPHLPFEGGYLLPEEIPKYCNIIEGVIPADVRTASTLIDGYLGHSFEPQDHTERVKLFHHHRGRLDHRPVITIKKVVVIGECVFGRLQEEVPRDSIVLDPENDGYFSYFGARGLGATIYKLHSHLLEVTYTSGFDVYPEKLKTACAMLSCNVRQAMSYNGAKQLSSLDFQVLMTDDSFFTSDIKRLLQEFK